MVLYIVTVVDFEIIFLILFKVPIFFANFPTCIICVHLSLVFCQLYNLSILYAQPFLLQSHLF